MKIGIVQNVQLLLLKQVIKILWLVDLITGYPLNSTVSFAARPLVMFCIFLMIGIYSVSFKTFLSADTFENTMSSLRSFNISRQQGSGVPLEQQVPVVLGAIDSVKAPIKTGEVPFPQITARSVLVADSLANTYLYEQNKSQRLASASTTKLMTALIALNIYEPDEILVVPKDCTEIDSTKAGLPAGERFTVDSLLNAMLVYSAGDAACVLGSFKIDSNEFLYLMNEKAFELGMKHTFFTNTIGLDGLDGAHFSSAEDLYTLAKASMQKDEIKQIVKKIDYTLSSVDGVFTAPLSNTNKLLSEIPNSIGIKTGTTLEAGEVLIYNFKDGAKDLIIIVMGSTSRFEDTKAILNWVQASYKWE